MGLFKAFAGSTFSYIRDMWVDYIYCDSMDNNTLVQKGHARSNPGAGPKANDNVITEGSKIAVNEGQTLVIVENGQILDFTSEPGGYEYHFGTEPSLFCGEFGHPLKKSFELIKGRFAYGGQPLNDQRAYFINTKEIMNIKFGMGNIPYRDSEFNITVILKGFGVFSIKVTDPLILYTNVCGNVEEQFRLDAILPQLKIELQNALLPAIGELSLRGIPYDKLTLSTEELIQILREKLNQSWTEERGLKIHKLAFSNLMPDEDSVEKIRELQESRVYSGNKAMLGARVGAAQASAMESAAENIAGAVTGFMGMNMAQNTGNINVNELLKDNQASVAAEAGAWTCSCGMTIKTKFCPNCGQKRLEQKKCGSCDFLIPIEFSNMRFCPNCGKEI